jgi:hypothetical protein
MDGMIPGFAPTLTPDVIRAAAAELQRQGMPLTKANLAEMAAVMAQPAAPAAPAPAAAAPAVRGGPTSTAAQRAQAAIDAKRRQGPPADMLARRAQVVAPGGIKRRGDERY